MFAKKIKRSNITAVRTKTPKNQENGWNINESVALQRWQPM